MSRVDGSARPDDLSGLLRGLQQHVLDAPSRWPVEVVDSARVVTGALTDELRRMDPDPWTPAETSL